MSVVLVSGERRIPVNGDFGILVKGPSGFEIPPRSFAEYVGDGPVPELSGSVAFLDSGEEVTVDQILRTDEVLRRQTEDRPVSGQGN